MARQHTDLVHSGFHCCVNTTLTDVLYIKLTCCRNQERVAQGYETRCKTHMLAACCDRWHKKSNRGLAKHARVCRQFQRSGCLSLERSVTSSAQIIHVPESTQRMLRKITCPLPLLDQDLHVPKKLAMFTRDCNVTAAVIKTGKDAAGHASNSNSNGPVGSK